MTIACPLIEVSGRPYQRGQSHGQQAAGRIRKGISHYVEQLRRLSLTPAELSELVHDYLPIIEGFDESYVEEMRGIAKGADVPFEEIILLNARTEIVKLARRPDLRAHLKNSSFLVDGCTGVVAAPPATRGSMLIHAQNWDWKRECAETVSVLRVRRDDGPDLMTFTEAGALARTGFNSVGICIAANYLESDRDYRRAGVPLALIRRKALDQQYLAKAYSAVSVTEKSCSNNMIVSHRSGLAVDFECAPDETFQVDPVNGLLVHANHFVSPVALSKLQDKGMATMPDSLYRDRRVRAMLMARHGDITIEDIQAALFDEFETPWSVCRPALATNDSNLTATVAMIVMVPEQGLMKVAILPAVNKSFSEFQLDMQP
jgi:isopenicillin-N N-acyltransferase-like protein